MLDVNFYFLDKNLKSTPIDYTILYPKQRPANGRYWPASGPSWIGNGYDSCRDLAPSASHVLAIAVRWTRPDSSRDARRRHGD